MTETKKLLVCGLALALCIGACACSHKAPKVKAANASPIKPASSQNSQPDSSSSLPSSSSKMASDDSSSALPAASPDTEDPSGSSDTAPSARETVSVLIPEGFTASQIGKRLEANGVCSEADFDQVVSSYSFTESVMRQIPNDPHRCYRLEGYLYPNTYQFYKNMKPQDAVGKMLRLADTSIYGTYDDQTVILASILQKEAANYSDMVKISAVFHNRLKQNMPLQADSTVFYLKNYLTPAQCDTYKYYYNTVSRIKSLPAGPICNPGANALKAAANPDNDPYLYFVSDKAGNYYYATTYAEQQQNCIKAGVNIQNAEN